MTNPYHHPELLDEALAFELGQVEASQITRVDIIHHAAELASAQAFAASQTDPPEPDGRLIYPSIQDFIQHLDDYIPPEEREWTSEEE